MKFTGIIEDTFRGRTIFRGYATLRNLALVSKSGEYQRDANVTRLPEIKDFMENSTFSFFPELIFGLQLSDPNALRKLKYEQARGSILLEDGIKFTKANFLFANELGVNPKTKVISIELPDNIIANKPLTRLDGNHRLSVIDEILESDNPNAEIGDIIVPFSILLQIQSDESKQYESAFFYLINSKAQALTSEENLSAIFNNKNFSKQLKEELLGIPAQQIECIENLVSFFKQSNIDYISRIYNNEYYTFTIDLIRFTHSNSYEQLQKSIIYLIRDDEDFKVEGKATLLILLKYLIDNNKTDYLRFAKWINNNDIGKIKDLHCEQLIEVYENIHRHREYKVFVAMPYISYKRVNDFNKLFKEVLKEISEKKVQAKVTLIPIMRFRGSSQRIDARLIKCIKDCDIFIADLTTCNENVIFEVGLAEGNNKPKLLIRAESDTSKMPFDEIELSIQEHVPFDMDKLQWIPYSNSGYYNDIKSIVKNNLPTILNESYGVPIIQ